MCIDIRVSEWERKYRAIFYHFATGTSHYEHAPGKLQRRDERGDWTSGLRIQTCRQDKSIEAPWLQGGAGVAAAARFDMSIAGAGNLGWLPFGGVEGKGKVGERERERELELLRPVSRKRLRVRRALEGRYIIWQRRNFSASSHRWLTDRQTPPGHGGHRCGLVSARPIMLFLWLLLASAWGSVFKRGRLQNSFAANSFSPRFCLFSLGNVVSALSSF